MPAEGWDAREDEATPGWLGRASALGLGRASALVASRERRGLVLWGLNARANSVRVGSKEVMADPR